MRIHRLALLDRFACAGAECPDTCCRAWTMALDEPTLARYRSEAPELLRAVAEGPEGAAMRRNGEGDCCVMLKDGLCGIQIERGAAYLGDACHFYPRVTRRLGERVRMSACLSCPVIAELALFDEDVPRYGERAVERLPHVVRDVLPQGLDTQRGEAIIDDFLALAGDPTVTPERAVARIVDVAQVLSHQPVERWPDGVPFLIDSVDERLAVPASRPEDAHRLLLALAALAKAARHPMGARFKTTFETMERALGVRLDWQTFALEARAEGPDLDAAYPRLGVLWQFARARLAPVLRRWLQAELDAMSFPFAGLGGSPAERAVLLALRFATVRLALMSAVAEHGPTLERTVIVRTVQSLSRLLDHLADPTLSLAIYREAGWEHVSRLRGLLGDESEPCEEEQQELPPVPYAHTSPAPPLARPASA